MHFIVFLLKAAGIILAAIAGLIVILFTAPVCYSFRVEKGEETEGQITVAWLFHLLFVKAGYIEKTFEYQVRIFGYQVAGNQEKFLKKKKKKQEKKKKGEKKKTSAQKRDGEEPAEETGSPSAMCADADVSKEIAADAEMSAKQDMALPPKKSEGGKKRKEKKEKNAIKEKITAFKQSVQKIRELYIEYHGEQLLSLVKNSIFKVIRHIFPRKLTGRIRFGLDDPAQTGMLTGIAAIMYPRYHKSFTLEPDFQAACFEADCTGRGRIHLGFFLYILVRFLMNRDVRRLTRMALKSRS